MPSDASRVRELTRRLLAREARSTDAPDGGAVAVRNACERTHRELAQWVGPTGSRALLSRALAEAQAEYAFLKEVGVSESDPVLGGISELLQAHGAPAVAAALESVLATLLGLLGRLVGDDLAARLVEQSIATHSRSDEGKA